MDPREVPTCQPVLKWAGGKRQLQAVILRAINRLHPTHIKDYYEPFFGGGAIFFALYARGRIERAILSDMNADLINFYEVLRDTPQRLISHLKKLQAKGFTEKSYYEIRGSRVRSPAGRAARLLYLNKTGFNGLYRVNQQGKFNVPFGHRKHPRILDEDALWSASQALQCAVIRRRDFQEAIAVMPRGNGSFVYLDPPYWPTRATANFTSYTSKSFGELDQKRLLNTFARLTEQGVSALLSNSCVPETRKLYRGFRSVKVSARRNINSNGSGRGEVSELLVESRWKS